MWTNFFITTAGASAALAGLVFVALSVNISRILQYSHLPMRAAATIGTLMLILVSSIAFLIPQGSKALGTEIIIFGACAWLLEVQSSRKGIIAGEQSKRPRYEAMSEAFTGQIQVLPFIVGGILLLIGRERGVYWVAVGVFMIFIFSVLNAWVLLVEILR